MQESPQKNKDRIFKIKRSKSMNDWVLCLSYFRLKGVITNNSMPRKDPEKVARSIEAASAIVVDMLLNKAPYPGPLL